jgi:hypothetical protein
MPHGEEEAAELEKTASFDKLRMSARGEPVEQAFSPVPFVSGRPKGLHYIGTKNALGVGDDLQVVPYSGRA